jgi:tRNA pseudouridine55 synthase
VLSTQSAAHITEQQVLAALPAFRGEIEQVPSMFSAIKHNGQPLYKLARQGKEVERKRRRVAIYELELEGFRGGEHPQVDVFVRCSKGTYIRSIAEDLGKALGCGGHVSVLRRVQAGPFDDSKAVTLEQLEALRDDDAFEALDALLEPADAAISDLPKLELVDSAADFILQGQPVMALHGPMAGEVRLYRKNGGFLGLGEMTDDGRVAPKRLIATNSD